MKTAKEWQDQAIRETGGTTANSKFTVNPLYGTSGGSWKWEINGQVTAAIPFPCSAASLAVALDALSTVGQGGALVTGALGGPYSVEFVAGNAGMAVEAPFVDGTLLNPAQELEVEVDSIGYSNDYSLDAATYWANNDKAKSDKHRFLLVKYDLIILRIGQLSESAVDTAIGQNNRQERKDSQLIDNLRVLLGTTQSAITAEVNSLQAGSRATYGGVMKAGLAAKRRFGG